MAPALSFSRHVLAAVCTASNIPSFEECLQGFSTRGGEDMPRMSGEPALVDVILWVGGALRGSQFASRDSLLEAVYEATVRSAHDKRFALLEASELKDTRIEITIIKTPFLPVSPATHELDETRAYAAQYEGKLYWYVPAVFNCRSFRSLGQFLEHLVVEKIGTPTPGAKLSFYTAEVEDGIELSGHDPVVLHGPVPEVASAPDTHQVVEQALDYLVRHQEEGGNIAPIQSPFTPPQQGVADWVRLAHLAWALSQGLSHASFARQAVYEACRDSVYTFLTKHQERIASLNNQLRAYTLVYLTRAARALGDTAEEARCFTTLQSLPRPKDSLLEIEYLLELERGEVSPERKRKIIAHAAQLRDTFHRTRDTADLASFANLMNLFDLMGERFADASYREYARSLATWYASQQKADGSFPQSAVSGYAYTRGTGKVLEALLSRGLLEDKSVARRAFAWLASLQYNEVSTYFISRERHEEFMGGLRHDYRNAAVWIDSLAHLILAHSSRETTAKQLR